MIHRWRDSSFYDGYLRQIDLLLVIPPGTRSLLLTVASANLIGETLKCSRFSTPPEDFLVFLCVMRHFGAWINGPFSTDLPPFCRWLFFVLFFFIRTRSALQTHFLWRSGQVIAWPWVKYDTIWLRSKSRSFTLAAIRCWGNFCFHVSEIYKSGQIFSRFPNKTVSHKSHKTAQ